MGLFDKVTSTLFGGGEQKSSTYVNKVQEGFLNDLYQRAQDQFIQSGFAQGQAGRTMADQLTERGNMLIGRLGQAGQALNPFIDESQVMPQLDVLNQQLGRQFELGLNRIQNRFGLAGTTGSRAGVAGGEALEGFNRNLSLGIADILNNDRGMRQQAATDFSRFNLLGNTSALNALPGQFGLSQAGYQSQYAGLNNLANLLGSPTVLSSSSGYNSTGILNAAGNFFGGILPN